MEAPAPIEETRPVVRQAPAPASQSEIRDGRIQAPPTIPTHMWIPTTMEPPQNLDVMGLSGPASGPGSADNPVNGRGVQPIVHLAPQTMRHISGA